LGPKLNRISVEGSGFADNHLEPAALADIDTGDSQTTGANRFDRCSYIALPEVRSIARHI
jgi:hypothetical protein